ANSRNQWDKLGSKQGADHEMAGIEFLRTADRCFTALPNYPWAGRYIDGLASLQGLRMHILDEGPPDAEVTWLCLHGNPTWSYLYRHMMPVFLAAGHRVVAPDMPGFGKSDKPVDIAQHRFSWHRSILLELIEAMDLKAINLVVQDWGGLLGLTLPMENRARYRGLLVMNTYLATASEPLPEGFLKWRAMCASKPDFSIGRLLARGNPHLTAQEAAAYDAPYPEPAYRAATRAFPEIVPASENDDGVLVSRAAARFWQDAWQGRSMMAVGMLDPVFSPASMEALRQTIKHCPPPMMLDEAGHFVQEHGAIIADAAITRL
ncbi:MAG: alpha/beta fold hydrolase, partial [Betaproteobacteria bacterium]|nr:alpha/beta fold hydrolase [Betaproteobacteria bacterium]